VSRTVDNPMGRFVRINRLGGEASVPSWAQQVVQCWGEGAFPIRLQSLQYPFAEDGREYATQGVQLARRVGATGQRVRVPGAGGGIVSPRGRAWSAW
jgi:hypothetical protein